MFSRLKNNLASGEISVIKAGEYLPAFIFLLLIAIIYLCLHNIYRTENVDDVWSLSFAYNFLFKHISSDLTFGAVTGGCGVMYFGKTYAYIYGTVLDLFGWTKSNAIYLSTVFLWCSAIIWYLIIHRIIKIRKLAVWFAILILITEPFFEAANEARPDALTFLLVSVAFLAFIYEKPSWAGLCAMIAFETHPMGIIAFFYCLAAFIANLFDNAPDRKKVMKQIISFLGGFGLGILYYLLLHYQFLTTWAHSMTASNRGHQLINNFMIEYFVYTDYARHMPELLFILTSLVIFIHQKYYRDNKYILSLLIVLPCVIFLVKRPNFRYVLYIYPVFLLLILETFRRIKSLKIAVVILLILVLPSYTLFFLRHYHYNLDTYLNKVNMAVPHNQIPVVGAANNWFAFKERHFYALNYNWRFSKLKLKEFYLIENKNFRHDEFPEMESIIRRHYSGITISKFNANRELYRVKLEKVRLN